MNVAILASRAQLGTQAPPVTVEVFLSGGLPIFSIVGLPETAVRESKDRVRGAILSGGFPFPQERITVSLGPADMRKTGGRFDLAIALGILAARKCIPAESFAGYEFFGELALNGELRSVPGTLPAAICAAQAGHAIIVPRANAVEAALSNATVIPAASLLEVTAHLCGNNSIRKQPRTETPNSVDAGVRDLQEVRGQGQAKRALEIAAAGGHNLLFIGPPGTGKSMLARRMPGILPDMSESESLATAAVDSVLGLPLDLARWRQRPFRAPHHSASAPALVGGGPDPRPGEISRAHNGVLFLDELPEFSRNVLEVLREPLESGTITISRARSQVDFPARIQLIAAMNPCPCGYNGDPGYDCRCSADRIANYRNRISGPLLDRMDLHVAVGRPARRLTASDDPDAQASSMVRARVVAARSIQNARSGRSNAQLHSSELSTYCKLDVDSERLLERAVEQISLSVRSQMRVQRVARTIADLAEASDIRPAHVAEALSLRCLDRRV